MSTIDVKPTSNRKAGAKPEAASEPFKRAVASCTRALARHPDLEVTFSTDKPALVNGPEGAKARLPEPPRKPNPREAAILRGVADSFALRLACHNEAVHRRLAPQNPAARALFDAVEQARVEAIGARRMEGVASNLERDARRSLREEPVRRGAHPRRGAARGGGGDARARAPDRLEAPGRGRAADRPLARVRRGEGRGRPRPARRRDPRPARLREARPEAPDLARPHERRGRRRRGQGRRRAEPAARGAGRGRRRGRGEPVAGFDAARGRRRHDRRRRRGRDGHGRGALDRTRGRRRGGRRGGGGREPARRRPSRRSGGRRSTRPIRRSSTRSSTPPSCATPTSWQRLREYLDKQLQNLAFGRGAARQPPAAPPDGAAEPVVGFRPRGGRARQRAPDAHHHRPAAAAVLQAGEGHGVPRHGRVAAHRQFRLDARPADHGRCDLRRHPRPHARALRGQGRNPRLHHPRLEGRAVARGVAAGGEAPEPRPAQRPAPPDLQVGRRARGGARGRTSG